MFSEIALSKYNNASFVVYVFQSQHYQNTNNPSFVFYVFKQESRREGWTDARSAVGFCLGSGLFGSYNSDQRLLHNLEITIW